MRYATAGCSGAPSRSWSRWSIASIDLMGEAYPEIVEHAELIRRIADSEEERFSATLRQGLAFLDEEIETLEEAGETVLDGAKAFALHDTYGFPVELTAEIAAENGLTIDMASFEREMAAQRERARAAVKDDSWDGLGGVFSEILAEMGPTEFVGYEYDETDATVAALLGEDGRVEQMEAGQRGEIVLDRTAVLRRAGRSGRRHRYDRHCRRRRLRRRRHAYPRGGSRRPTSGSSSPVRSPLAKRSPPPSTSCAASASGAITPPPICCTGRCGWCLAITSSSPVRSSHRNGSASTSLTSRRRRSSSCRRSSAWSTTRSWRTTRLERTRPRLPRRRSPASPLCSARSTASSSASSRSATSPRSCAAART